MSKKNWLNLMIFMLSVVVMLLTIAEHKFKQLGEKIDEQPMPAETAQQEKQSQTPK